MFGQLVPNTDASFIEDSYSGSCGAVIRDGAGFFITASTVKLEHVGDVESAEAAALLKGLKLARSVGANSIVARADNITIVDAMANNTGHSMVADPILDECRQICTDFGKVLFEFCNRESNTVAHTLAQHGRDDPPSLWLDVPPGFILDLLADDVSII